MRRVNLLGGILVAVIALGVAAPGVASAEETGSPSILPIPTEKEPLKFTSQGGLWTLANSGGKVDCEKQKNEGSFTSRRQGTALASLSGCKLGSLKCNSTGASSGDILLPTNIQLVRILPEGYTELGLAELLSKAFPVTCETAKAELKGTVIGEFSGVTAENKTNLAGLLFAEAEGKQEFKECDIIKEFCLEGEKHKKFELLAKFSVSESLSEARELTEGELTFAKEFEVDGAPSGQPKFSTTAIKFSITSGKSIFKAAGGSSISCQKDKGEGEVTGAATVTISSLVYEECSGTIGGSCPATVTFKALTGELGNVASGEASSGLGVLLKAKEGSTFASFECGTTSVTISGSVAGEVQAAAKGSEESNILFTPSGSGMKIKAITTTKLEDPKLELHAEEASLESTETLKAGTKGLDAFVCLPVRPAPLRSLWTCIRGRPVGNFSSGWDQFDII